MRKALYSGTLLLLFACVLSAQTTRTTVADTIYDGAGGLVTGSCTYKLSSGRATGADGYQVAAEPVTVRFVNGAFTASIVPTDTMTPDGQYYAATCSGSRGWSKSGNWLVVTSTDPLRLRDVWTATAPSPSISIPLSQLAQGGATSGQGICWNGAAYAPGSCAGAGGSGLGRYAATLSSTSVTVLATTHGLGVNPAVATCKDSLGAVFDPGSISITSSGDVTIASVNAMTGSTCILQGSSTGSGQYAASLSGTSLTVLASLHGLGTNVTVPTCYDVGNLRFEPGSISINSSGDVTIASGTAMGGKCILQ